MKETCNSTTISSSFINIYKKYLCSFKTTISNPITGAAIVELAIVVTLFGITISGLLLYSETFQESESERQRDYATNIAVKQLSDAFALDDSGEATPMPSAMLAALISTSEAPNNVTKRPRKDAWIFLTVKIKKCAMATPDFKLESISCVYKPPGSQPGSECAFPPNLEDVASCAILQPGVTNLELVPPNPNPIAVCPPFLMISFKSGAIGSCEVIKLGKPKPI